MNFDQIWASNRFKYRPGLSGQGMRKDPATGFLEAVSGRGFKARDKAIFIARLKSCSSKRAIARSIPIDIQAVYDHIALDMTFREQVIACEQIKGRKARLNEAMEHAKVVTSQVFLSELANAAKKYVPGI